MEEKNNGVQGFEGSGVQGGKNMKPGAEGVAPGAEGMLKSEAMGPIMAGFDNGQVNQAELPDQTNQVGEIKGSPTLGQIVEARALIKESGAIDLSEAQVKIMDQVVDQIDDFAKDMIRKPDLFGNEVFSADLVMTAIRNTQHGVTFEVQNPEGFRITGLTHIQMDRKDFPVDDDFNLSFINAPFKEPKELVVKRDGFRKYTKMRLVILMEE